MSVVVALVFSFSGAVAVLAGLSDSRRSRRLRGTGERVWAMAIPPPRAATDASDGRQRPYLQYTLADGRVIERVCPGSVRKASMLAPGQQVLVWYDPADPSDVVVFGRDTQVADRAFVVVGLLFILLGVLIVSFT
jgi:hypothetical protein